MNLDSIIEAIRSSKISELSPDEREFLFHLIDKAPASCMSFLWQPLLSDDIEEDEPIPYVPVDESSLFNANLLTEEELRTISLTGKSTILSLSHILSSILSLFHQWVLTNQTQFDIHLWAKDALKALKLYDGRDKAAILCAIGKGPGRTIPADIAEVFGEDAKLFVGHLLHTIYLGGRLMGGPGEPVRPEQGDTEGTSGPSIPDPEATPV